MITSNLCSIENDTQETESLFDKNIEDHDYLVNEDEISSDEALDALMEYADKDISVDIELIDDLDLKEGYLGSTSIPLPKIPKKMKSMNMKINYQEIFESILQNDRKKKNLDYFLCSFHLLANQNYIAKKYFKEIIWSLIVQSTSPISEGENNNNDVRVQYPICKFSNQLKLKLESKFRMTINLQNLKDGYISLKLAAILINYAYFKLQLTFVEESLTLKVLSNLFQIELPSDFKTTIDTTLSVAGIDSKNLKERILSLASPTKCVFSNEFNRYYGFSLKEMKLNKENVQENLSGKETIEKVSIAEIKDNSSKKVPKYFYDHLYYPSQANDYQNCISCDKVIMKVASLVVEVGQADNTLLNFAKKSETLIISPEKIKNQANMNEGKKVETAEQFIERLELQVQTTGDINSMYELAQAYYFGNDDLQIPMDRERAIEHYRQAAEGGHQYAHADLGLIGFDADLGRMVPNSFDHLIKAANQGVVSAINALGHSYEHG